MKSFYKHDLFNYQSVIEDIFDLNKLIMGRNHRKNQLSIENYFY